MLMRPMRYMIFRDLCDPVWRAVDNEVDCVAQIEAKSVLLATTLGEVRLPLMWCIRGWIADEMGFGSTNVHL